MGEQSITKESKVTLREVSRETVRTIIKLDVAENQKRFVAPNAYSISEAYFEPKAWFRAIYADETPVGFIMLYDNPDKPVYFLWRLMVDGRYQGLGFGRRAVELLVDYVRTRPNATELLVSYVPEDGGPEMFYRKLGFEPTGEMEGIEVVARKSL